MNTSADHQRIRLRDAVRYGLRTVAAVLGLVLFAVVTLIGNGYLANRRLMTLMQLPKDHAVADGSLGFTGARTDWLERWIGFDTASALLCRPTYFLVYQQTYLDDSAVLNALQSSSSFEKIYIHRRNIPEGCLEAIARRHPVRTFHFEIPSIRPADAAWLRKMKKLREVSIKQTARESTEIDWSWLGDLPNLKKASAFLSNATNTDALQLAHHPALDNISLYGMALSDDGVSELCQLPALEYLSLEGPHLSLHFPQGRKFATTLVGLELKSILIDEASLLVLEGIPDLTIVGGQFGDSELELLARLPTLRRLELIDLVNVSDKGLSLLVSCPSLSEVRISGCGATSTGLIHLNSLPNWTLLQFEGVTVQRATGDPPLDLTADNVAEFLSNQRSRQGKPKP